MGKNKKIKPDKEDKELQTELENEAQSVEWEPSEKIDKAAEATEAESEKINLETELLKIKDEFAQLNDQFLRTIAEYDNFRKRTAKEKTSIYQNAVSDVCKAWLPVLDNLDRAVEATQKTESEQQTAMLEGIEMVRKQALEVMAQLGVAEIDCQDKEFNPEYHEAVAHIEDEKYAENMIVEVIKKGYIKDDQVIRHSVVVVAN